MISFLTAYYDVYRSHMSEEYEMGVTRAGTTAKGTTVDKPPAPQCFDENRKPSNPGPSPLSIQISQHNSHDKSIPQDALAKLSPNELVTLPTNTDLVGEFDALLDSLESDDEEEVSIEDQVPNIGEARAVPSVLLETSPNDGLDDAEVLSRRKRYGWNIMKEETHSHVKTFLMFFVGPIQCVMLVGRNP